MDTERRLELIGLLAARQDWKTVVLIGEELLNDYYPATVFDGSSGDAGPDYVVALRKALSRVSG